MLHNIHIYYYSPSLQHGVGLDPAHIWFVWNPCVPDLGRHYVAVWGAIATVSF